MMSDSYVKSYKGNCACTAFSLFCCIQKFEYIRGLLEAVRALTPCTMFFDPVSALFAERLKIDLS